MQAAKTWKIGSTISIGILSVGVVIAYWLGSMLCLLVTLAVAASVIVASRLK